MQPDLTFFERGANPLLDFTLRSDIGVEQIGALAVIVAILLGYAAYTDIFRGWIIPNWTNALIAVLAVASVPLIYADPTAHFVQGAIAAAIIGVLGLFAFQMGDTKLYMALALLLGLGVIPLMLFSWLLLMPCGVPLIVRKHARRLRAKRNGGADVGDWKTFLPLGPAISAAAPITLYVAGATLTQAAILLGVEVATVVVCLAGRRWLAPAIERAERDLAAESENERHREQWPHAYMDAVEGQMAASRPAQSKPTA